MKSPVTAIEVRWRGSPDDAWESRRFLPGQEIFIPEPERGALYEVQACSIGVPGAPSSEWVDASVLMPETNRTGAAALPPVVFGNTPSRWVSGTNVSWSATDTEATISVSAGVLQVGEKQISYAPSAVVVPGTPNTAVRFWLYYDDYHRQGGARTLGATTDPTASMAAAGRILIIPVDVTFAPAGGSTGGGGDIGGGGGGSGGPKPGDPTQPEIQPE